MPKHNPLSKKIMDQINTPIDPDFFLYCVSVGHAAHSGDLVDSHIKPAEGPGLHFTNTPENRMMMAVMHESGHLSGPERFSLSWRVLHLYKLWDLIKTDARLDDAMRPAGEMLDVRASVLRAYAGAGWVQTNKDIEIDADQLCSKYAALRAEEGRADA